MRGSEGGGGPRRAATRKAGEERVNFYSVGPGEADPELLGGQLPSGGEPELRGELRMLRAVIGRAAQLKAGADSKRLSDYCAAIVRAAVAEYRRPGQSSLADLLAELGEQELRAKQAAGPRTGAAEPDRVRRGVVASDQRVGGAEGQIAPVVCRAACYLPPFADMRSALLGPKVRLVRRDTDIGGIDVDMKASSGSYAWLNPI